MKNPLISIIIITYKRKEMLLDLVKNIKKQNFKDFEIIIVDNDPNSKIKVHGKRIIYLNPRRNLGVPGGRKFGIQKAKGDILVFIDDDAFFQNKNSLDKIKNEFRKEKGTGILTFKIINSKENKVLKHEFPYPDLSKVNDSFYVGHFIGCGHAIHRKIISEGINYYSNLLKYWGEELDLSYAAINKGYKIKYFPSVCVIHKTAISGRLPKKENFFSAIFNKSYINKKYLPFKYYIINSFIWICFFLKESLKMGELFIIIKPWIRGYIKAKKFKDILNKNAISYLKKTKGRLIY